MRTESFKQDLINFIEDKGDIADFILLIKNQPDARDILAHYGYNFEFLGTMSEEDICREYRPLSHGCLAEDAENGVMLDILVKAMEKANEVKSPSEKFVNGFADVLSFDAGIPIVCDIMIGNELDYSMLDAIQAKDTGDFDYALHEYNVYIWCEFDVDETVNEIDIQMPFDDWSLDNIKALYAYISKRFNYDSRKATYSFDYNDELSHVKIELSNSLYEIYIEDFSYEGKDYLKIKIVRFLDDTKVYQALNTLLRSREIDDFVLSTVKTIVKQKNYERFIHQ